MADRIRLRTRRRKANLLARFIDQHGIRSVLLVGAGWGAKPLNRMIEEAAAAHTQFAVATDLHESTRFPFPYVCSDGLALPFSEHAFDLVVSNAVIEHVGQEVHQRSFLSEHRRVGRHWFVTTPNRWFPLESHTRVALLHWLPSWRRRRVEFTRLLSRRELRALLEPGQVVVGQPWSATFVAVSSPLDGPPEDRLAPATDVHDERLPG